MCIRESCIHYTGTKLTNRGYGRYRYKGKMTLAHRIAYCEANNVTLEDIKGKVVRHKCDNPVCINPDHLEIGTQQDNIKDMNDRGRQRNVHGADSPNAKITDDVVKAIRAEYVKGSRKFGYSALARKYGISDVMVSHIANNRSWKHV
ncbi:TPA: HNH endonuclease [Salmonella enterica]|nr:HNH endonuclease [Salmonella enterica]HCH9147456.1 HNH endonuclease [Salmonella enterica]HCH9455857.1 HNH endonuclease [Salmonella enterica]HCM0375463.1 HNH endonuclease [Salmonella enterica]